MKTQVLDNPLTSEDTNPLFVLILMPRLGGFNVPKPLELEICGRSILSWVEGAVAKYPYRKIDVSPTDDIITLVRSNSTKHKYTLVVYADSPMLTTETIDAALAFAVNLAHSGVRLPRGWLFETNYILNSESIDTVPLNNVNAEDFLAIYNYSQLSIATNLMRNRINTHHMENGVHIVDPNTTYIDDGVVIEAGAVIQPNTTLCKGSHIKSGAKIGPFAHIRERSTIGKDCKIGNFVEIKNSTIGEATKIAHMSYIGDATVGRHCNIGCGVVVCNYDGEAKHRTQIGDSVFVGSNSNLVAPLTLESNSFIAAGSTIVANVPSGALGIARARQENKENWKRTTAQADLTTQPISSVAEVIENPTEAVATSTVAKKEPTGDESESTMFAQEVKRARQFKHKQLPTFEVVEIQGEPATQLASETDIDEQSDLFVAQTPPPPKPETMVESEPTAENTTEPQDTNDVVETEPTTQPEHQAEADFYPDNNDYDDAINANDDPIDEKKITPEFDWDNAEHESFYEGRLDE